MVMMVDMMKTLVKEQSGRLQVQRQEEQPVRKSWCLMKKEGRVQQSEELRREDQWNHRLRGYELKSHRQSLKKDLKSCQKSAR